MEEIWKPVLFKGVNYKGHYEVSNMGRIKSLKDTNGRICKPYYKGRKGNKYHKISLCMNGKTARTTVHQLVYWSFIGEIEEGFVIDHVDSNPFNNKLSNLKKVTFRDNCSKEKTIKSGLPVGVCQIKSKGSFLSDIRLNGKKLYLGTYKEIEHASKAYQIALRLIIKNNKISNKYIRECINNYRIKINLNPIK